MEIYSVQFPLNESVIHFLVFEFGKVKKNCGKSFK